MENKDLAEKLGDLMHLDVDAVRAYDDAIRHIDDMDIRGQLDKFKFDHQRHVDEITEAIRQLGEEPPKQRPDVKGVFLEGMTTLRSMGGTDSALKAMRTNEQSTNKAYEAAVGWDAPESVHEMLVRGRGDERRHLDYIEQHLSVGAGAAGAPPQSTGGMMGGSGGQAP